MRLLMYWKREKSATLNLSMIKSENKFALSSNEILTIYEKFTELSRLFADIGAVAENYIDAENDSIQKNLLTEEYFQDLSSKELASAEIGLAELRANLGRVGKVIK